ncbi:MAG: RluA family pseudouridine synthase [Alphaproteobacteria bacterium]|nr:RluA family pseudouridine synthase [Alphaproteobacteria bacterium]
MSGVEIIKVKPEDDGMRLNRWFLKYYPALSLSRFQKLLRTKQIKVDNQRAEAGLKLSAGQEIRVPPLEKEKAEPLHIGLSSKDTRFIQSLVIYKDENIIVLNKPSGLAVQGGTNTVHHIDALLDGLLFNKTEKPKLVHRIDKDTSGILVLARNRIWADKLTQAFREHTLQKTYLALVAPAPKQGEGEIKAPLEKIGEKILVTDSGKTAHSLYKTIDTVGDKFALLAVEPLTGRTHQIRVHLQYIGSPIIGDDKYFLGEKREKYTLLTNKLHLHAYKIDLSSLYNKKLLIKAPLPEYFKQDLEHIGIHFKG